MSVALPATVLCFAVALLGLVSPDLLIRSTGSVTRLARVHLDDVLVFITVGLLLLSLALALGPYGRVRLGAPTERPEFSTPSWVAMMFAAGMGQGLLFFGVAEPVQHFISPLASPEEARAANEALVVTMFHWGFHVWAIYCVAGLAAAYFAFRRGQPYLTGAPMRSAFRSRTIHRAAWGVDVLALIAVVFGLGGSVALGSKQLAAGVGATLGWSGSPLVLAIVLLWVVIAAALISASTTLSKGIRWLSNINIVLMCVIMAAVFVLGPTAHIARTTAASAAEYVASLPALSARAYPYTTDPSWFQSKSLTYFLWMASWSPFVAIFLARISRGRTVREFVAGVLVVPTLFSVLSFAIFGSAGLHHVVTGGGDPLAIAANPALSVFSFLETLPFAEVLKGLALTTVFIFIVTSADSGTFVLGMLSSRGALNPPARSKIAWGLGLGLLSTAFLLGGRVDVILTMAMSGAVPFMLVLVVQAIALLRGLSADGRTEVPSRAAEPLAAIPVSVRK